MTTTEPLTTMKEAAAELGMSRSKLRERMYKWNIIPAVRIPHSPSGKGFTPAQMEQLREADRREKASA